MPSHFTPGVQDCPHCLAHLIILSDGKCPRCQGNALDTSSVDSSKTSTWICTTDKIPDLCIRCGTPTRHRIKIEHSEAWESLGDGPEDVGSSGIGPWLLTFLIDFVVVSLIRGLARIPLSNQVHIVHRCQSISVKVPECVECSVGQVFPLAASMQDSAMRIAAHVRFVDEHRTLNGL